MKPADKKHEDVDIDADIKASLGAAVNEAMRNKLAESEFWLGLGHYKVDWRID